MKKTWLALLGSGLLLSAALPAHAQEAPGCQFVLGFKTLHDLDANDVGDCVDNQAFAANGDAQQHTNKGLLAWRKADNWTAFTNGYRTWINGPKGLVTRLNNERYSWEADYNAPNVLKLLEPNGMNWTVAFERNLVLPSIKVDDGKGNLVDLPAKGRWINFYFRVRNNQSTPRTLSSANIVLRDKQGRRYVSDFELRQVDSQGSELMVPGLIPPGATVLLRVTMDIPQDASGGILQIPGGNDIAAL